MMKTEANTHDNTQKANSRNNIRNKIAGLATLAFLAYAPNALALNAQPSEQQQKKQQVIQKVMPGLQFKVYDSQGKTLEDWTKLTEKHILFPPFTVPYGGSFELTYQNGTIVHNNIELDVLISNLQNQYLTNSKPLPNRGPRAFPTKINTIEAGMKPDTYYAIYASKEKAGSLDIKEVGIKPSKEMLASATALLYVRGKCPLPEIKEVVKEVEVFKTLPPSIMQMPSEPVIEPVRIEDACKGGSLLMINPFYTGQKNWGGDFVINARLAKGLGLGAGFFFQPNTQKMITTNLQHDQYTVGDLQIIGDTNLVTQASNEVYGVLGNILIGNPCKINLLVEGGVGWAKYHLKNSLEQTVKDAKTGELLRPQYVCNWSSEDLTKMIGRLGGALVMPLSKDKFYIFAGGGAFIGLPETATLKNSSGSIDKEIRLGPKSDWYAKVGFAIKL